MDNYYEGNRKSEDARMHASTPTATFIHFSIHPLFHSSDFLKLRHSRNKSEMEAKLERVHHAKLNKCSIRSFPCYVIAAMLEDDNATSLSFDSLGIDCKPSIPFTSRRGNTQLL